MESVLSSIRGRGGIATTAQLRSDGWGRGAIQTTLESGEIFRARQGWYVLANTDPTLLECVRIGGAATCSTGLSLHGLWSRHDSTLHVRVPAHDARLRTPRDSRVRLTSAEPVRVHWTDSARRGLTTPALAAPLECLRDSLLCQSGEDLLASADSFLARGRVSAPEWRQFLEGASAESRAVLQRASALRESGTESIFFWRFGPPLDAIGVSLRSQVRLDGVGRVDFVAGERLVIEVDGAAYHVDRQRFENDRRRDARAGALGHRVLRFSYEQVVTRWPEVEAAVWAAIARGDHL